MASSRYVCQSCGGVHSRWVGRCEACGEWNTISEEFAAESAPLGGKKRPAKRRAQKSNILELVSMDGQAPTPPRKVTGISELDRTCGGGLVDGSAVLIGGDPGIGKSTLLLQAVAALSENSRCAYFSGEEAVDQIRMRASRLGVANAKLELASVTNLNDILGVLDSPNAPEIIVVDSIQTMYIDVLESAPGTVGQVRACAQELIRVAKQRGTIVLMVGHVTKEGTIAGPKVLEHMVDTVLYFEGDRGHQFRILRAVKNRFGPTDEIGVFEMTDRGLLEVENPSALFLADRRGDISGTAVFAGMEGTRPVLVEIQALVAPSSLATPRRAVVGWDSARLAMVLAVLEARAGMQLSGNDIYLNVAGGLRISEPAADLAVAAALVSSLTGHAMPGNLVVFGELGLSGEVRPVSQAETRLKEAGKLGFERALMPTRRSGRRPIVDGMKRTEIDDVHGLTAMFSDETREPTQMSVN
jgi:DNA repair protein RadA/Sms